MSNQVLDRTPFVTMSTEQQRHFAEWGFVLLSGIVSPKQMVRIKEESVGKARYDWIERWPGPGQEELITNPKLLGLLRRCYGEDLRFFKSVYAEWRQVEPPTKERGRQGLHRDYAPDPGSDDYRKSCASWCNVGHYLVDLEMDEGPLWIVPGSHKVPWTHEHTNLEQFDRDARMVLAQAGDAVMFHNRTIHAGGVMQSERARPSVFLSYRPSWAAPVGEVPEWPAKVVNGVSEELRCLLAGQNDGLRVDPLWNHHGGSIGHG